MPCYHCLIIILFFTASYGQHGIFVIVCIENKSLFIHVCYNLDFTLPIANNIYVMPF